MVYRKEKGSRRKVDTLYILHEVSKTAQFFARQNQNQGKEKRRLTPGVDLSCKVVGTGEYVLGYEAF